ncbi:TolC family protein [bacterium]|nr:TolC family protein [bacterium]
MKTIILILTLIAFNADALTLDEYLKIVIQKNKLVSSYDLSIEASKDKQIAGDLLLSPTLTAGYSVATDKSEPITVADKRTTTLSNLGLSKKFSSGTTLGVTADTTKYEYELPVTAGNNGYSTGRLGVSLQQSLWKDFFGHGTRLRQDREEATNKLETLGFELRKRATLIEMESDYWDYLVAQEDLKLKQANLDRAKKLESWNSNRVYNGISDQSDLLQVKALSASREVQLATAKDELTYREAKIRENMGLSDSEPLPMFTSNLMDARPYVGELSKQKDVVKIDTYITALEANVKQRISEETVDSLRPDLSLVGRYNTNSYNVDHQTMMNNIGKTERPTTFVGVTFSWMFGSDAKSSQLDAAKKDALAAQYRAEQAKLSGTNAWADFLRKYELTKQNVVTLEKIAQLQRDRAKQEQIKFSKGRTITLNVVTAETDSAEADVTYLRAKSGLRKLEATTQLYMSTAE